MAFGKQHTSLVNFAKILIENLSHWVIGQIEQRIFRQRLYASLFSFGMTNSKKF